MPLVGYFAGIGFKEIIMGIDHWIAFGLLAFIGAKMIYDSKKEDAVQEQGLNLFSVFALAIATSIDALMVGLSFAFLQVSIVEPILVIGGVTFSLSLAGFFLGCSLGRAFGHKIKIIGGLILIAIGIRILLEHML